MIRTYWNGEPAECRRVLVVVKESESDPPAAWWRGMGGTERRAVEVRYAGQTFYLDDQAIENEAERREERMAALPEDERRKMEALMRMFPDQPPARDGDGWLKVTVGRGSPQYGHRSLPVERVVREIEP